MVNWTTEIANYYHTIIDGNDARRARAQKPNYCILENCFTFYDHIANNIVILQQHQ